MSTALDHADLLRTRLLTAPTGEEHATPLDLRGVPVIVDRQKDIVSEVSKAVAKTTGCAVVILWTGYAAGDVNARGFRVAATYKITVLSKPILAGAALAADDILESILLRLWQWRPPGGHSDRPVIVGAATLIPNDSILIYECDLTIPTVL